MEYASEKWFLTAGRSEVLALLSYLYQVEARGLVLHNRGMRAAQSGLQFASTLARTNERS